MSSKRPGTVDYSKWDEFEDSDDESEESQDEHYGNPPRRESENEVIEIDDSGSDESGSDDSSEYESEEEETTTPHQRRAAPVIRHPQRRATPRVPPPSLDTLQAAWSADSTANLIKPCAQCRAPNAPCKCSRCTLVSYCNATCQQEYHPVHKLECIDAKQHRSYWGFFDRQNNQTREDFDEEKNREILLARRSSKRRRALQIAAASAAVERARRARIQRGVAKGGPGKGKAAEEREETCCSCQVEFTVQGDGGVAFSCPSSHYLCNECAGIYANSVMGELETAFPPKCWQCKGMYATEAFERQLTSQQQKTFRAYVARVALKEGEQLFECGHCGLFEVVTDDPVFWWCPHCGTGACRVCNKGLPFIFGGARANSLEFNLLIQNSAHKMCAKLRKAKQLIEEAIEEGSKMRCPGCNLAGRKDDACTHMTCTRCTTEWCYVCGLDIKTCDKAPPRDGGEADDIYLHNRDWERNDKRCPMYLTQILEVDLNWLGENWQEHAADETWEDDEKCVDYLHRFKTIKLLQQVREDIGPKDFVSTFVHFAGIRNSGYTVDEIVSTCTDKLIDRDECRNDGGGHLDDVQEEIPDDGEVDLRDILALSEVTAVADEQVREVMNATAQNN